MSTPKLDPALFLRAAEILDARDEWYACNALSTAAGIDWKHDLKWLWKRDHLPEVRFFAKVFKPRTTIPCWYDYDVEGADSSKNDEARIFGLILASILVKEGFEP